MNGLLIKIATHIKGNRGVAMVEFALVLPVLLLLFGAIIDFGFVMHQYLTMEEVARVASRNAQINRNDGMAKQLALASQDNSSKWDVTFTPPRPAINMDVPAGPIRVVVTVSYKRDESDTLTGLTKIILPEIITTEVSTTTEEI